jgi:hypothetical protein
VLIGRWCLWLNAGQQALQERAKRDASDVRRAGCRTKG